MDAHRVPLRGAQMPCCRESGRPDSRYLRQGSNSCAAWTKHPDKLDRAEYLVRPTVRGRQVEALNETRPTAFMQPTLYALMHLVGKDGVAVLLKRTRPQIKEADPAIC